MHANIKLKMGCTIPTHHFFASQICVYVTGFMKTVPNGTRNETYTLALPRNPKHMAIDGQVCFHWWLIADPVESPWCITGSVVQWMALIRMWLVPDCCQQLSQSVLWIESLSCHLLRTQHCCLCPYGRFNPPPATHLPPPPTPFTQPTPFHLPTPCDVPFMILQSLWKSCSKPSNVS